MKTIGILGGMSAASTQIYYRELCAMTRERLGGLHSPELLIRSLDFARIEALQMAGDWNSAVIAHNGRQCSRCVSRRWRRRGYWSRRWNGR